MSKSNKPSERTDYTPGEDIEIEPNVPLSEIRIRKAHTDAAALVEKLTDALRATANNYHMGMWHEGAFEICEVGTCHRARRLIEEAKDVLART